MAWSKDYGLEARNAAMAAELASQQAEASAQEAIDAKESIRTKWLPAVATVELRDSTYPSPENGDTVRVTEIATTYRFETGTGWVITDIYDASAIDSVTAQLGDKASLVHTHEIADVNGLQSELDGKLSASDTLTISNIDGLQTELDGKVDDADFTTHKAEDATDAHNASNISVADANNRFTGTNVETVLNELFQFANNGKTDIASVIGSPATSGDSFSQLKTHIQNRKNELATNLSAKGQTSVGTETLDSLVDKVALVNTGKKWAAGTASTPSSGTDEFTVTGLAFRPTKVMAYMTSSTDPNNHILLSIISADKDIRTNSTGTQSFGATAGSDTTSSSVEAISDINIVYNDGFRMYVNSKANANVVFKWFAYE